MGSLIVRETAFVRLLRFVRLLSPADDRPFNAGADFSPSVAGHPTYDQLSAMSAAAAFPWLSAAVNVKASNLSMLPLCVSDANGDKVESHPVLDLLTQPSQRVSGVQFRRQLLTDLLLTGDSYQLILGASVPESLLRLHPARSRVRPLTDGQPGTLEYNGSGPQEIYPWDRILNARNPSWEDTPASLYGIGAVQPLHDDLTTDQRVAQMTAAAAATGVPTGLLSPAKDETWDKRQVGEIRREYDKQMSSGTGLLIVGGSAKYDQLSLTPREMDYKEVRLQSRDAQLAAVGVPPSLVGLPGANYATDLNQARRYWEGLQGDAALLDDQWTRLVREFPNSEGFTVWHDFSGVDALQESRTARLNRVQQLWLMGVPLPVALEIEGFTGLPTFDTPAVAPPATPAATDEERAAVGRVFGFTPKLVTREDDERETERAALSGDYIRQVHTPKERAYTLVMVAFLNAQANRYALRTAEVLGETARVVGGEVFTRGMDEDIDAILLDGFEAAQLRSAISPTMTDAVRSAYVRALGQVGLAGTPVDPVRLNPAVEAQLGEMVTNVSTTTSAAVRNIVTAGLTDGSTINEMQALIQSSVEFTPTRALLVARTEATRSVTAGSLSAYQAASNDHGISVKVEWLSARDSEVRETHSQVDGTVVELGQVFTLSDGDVGNGPGDFSNAANVCNCRCTVIPVL